MKKVCALILGACLLLANFTVLAASKASQQAYDNSTQKGEIILPITDKSGTWTPSTAVQNYDGGQHLWSTSKGDQVTFEVGKVAAGNYEVYDWVCPHENNAEQMDFTISHNGKTSTATIYQKTEAGEKVEPGWVSLGVYDFSGAGEEKIVHICPGGNTRATGIKLVPTAKAITAPEEPKETAKPSAAPPVTSPADMEIDAEPFDGFSYVGEWKYSSALLGPMLKAPGSMWIADGEDEAYCQYDPGIVAVGNVRIAVFLLYWHENQATDVLYQVFHNGKVDEFHFDMTELNADQWKTLGDFDFAGTGDEYVRVVRVNGQGEKINTRASTVKFEILNDAASGGVWQTKYVTPQDVTAAARKAIAKLERFGDLQDHWAHYDVEYMADRGYIKGVEEDQFAPERTITRAEFVAILTRAMGLEEVQETAFADVSQDQWYFGNIGAASQAGLLAGLPVEAGFLPDQPITREEMALFIYNAIENTGKDDQWVQALPNDYTKFTDTGMVSDWAKEALDYLVHVSILKGTSETTVSPQETATRAQATAILKRFMQSYVWAGPPTDEQWALTFQDEFLGDSVNWDVWKSDASFPGHIQSSRWPENAQVKDGSLYLLTKKESRGGAEWTTGNIWVKPEVFRQSYGYWEARYKYTAAKGINNAFWGITQSNMINDPKEFFELDVNEGHYPNMINTNYHSSFTGERVQHSQQTISSYDLSQDYHTYAMEWNEDELIYYFDGEVVSVKENENASIPLYPYLSTAILNWAGKADDSADGTAMVVDYVRIWQREADVDNKDRTLINAGTVEQQPSTTPSTEVPAVKISEQQVDLNTYPGEIIIPAQTEGDSWKSSTAIPNYNGGEHYWSNVKGAVSKYLLEKVPAGEYKVYFWRLPHQFNASQMDFILSQDGKETPAGSVALMLAQDETADPGWVLMGTHTLTGDSSASIYSICPGSNVRATAIKLVPVK